MKVVKGEKPSFDQTFSETMTRVPLLLITPSDSLTGFDRYRFALG